MNKNFKTQRGFGLIMILIAIAVVLGVLALGVLLFLSQKPRDSAAESINNMTVPLTEKDPSTLEAQANLGTPNCPEVDYTGCDTSGNFETWQDDGQRNPSETEDRVHPYTGITYSK